jgi:[CysO sulfur-carrier protein]-S-L-cysteine hydrolase
MLKLTNELKNELIKLARKDSPIETCGYFSGIIDEIKEIIPLTNIDHSAEHFSFDPREQFRAVKDARAKGYQLIAVYHSHPASPARLSDEDLRLANDPRLFYVIVSLLTPDEPVIKAFKVNSGAVSEISILITEGEKNEYSTN